MSGLLYYVCRDLDEYTTWFNGGLWVAQRSQAVCMDRNHAELVLMQMDEYEYPGEFSLVEASQ